MRLTLITDLDALHVQAAREAVTAMEPTYSEAQAHLQESLSIQNDVILQVDFMCEFAMLILLRHSTSFLAWQTWLTDVSLF